MGMTNEKKALIIRYLKYNLESGAGYLITDEDAVEIIKALEQIDKMKRLFKTKMRTMTRDEFNEDFEDSTISDIKDEMWELYIFLHKIEEVLEDKAESEVNADDE